MTNGKLSERQNIRPTSLIKKAWSHVAMGHELKLGDESSLGSGPYLSKVGLTYVIMSPQLSCPLSNFEGIYGLGMVTMVKSSSISGGGGDAIITYDTIHGTLE
jgi:hypothetical protein